VRRPGRPRDARVEAAVLAATLELVASEGLAGLTVDAVAAKAGVGKATIYRRWSSKEALVLDAWMTCLPEDPAPDTGSLRGDIEAALAELRVTVGTGHLGRVLPQMVAAARTDPELGEPYRRYVARRRRRLATVLRRARDRGELGPDADLEAIQDLIVGPLIYRALVSAIPLDESFVRTVIDVVLAGVSPQMARS
jgi:AcrR family transcriptional regulator